MSSLTKNRKIVYIITVNFRAQEALIELLASINNLNLDNIDIKVLVIDSSNDINPTTFFNNNFNKYQAEIINLPENKGFAYAVNIGIKTAHAQSMANNSESFIWLLNPDVKLHPESLNSLLINNQPNTLLGSLVTQCGFDNSSLVWGAGGYIDSDLNVSMGHYNEPLSNVTKLPFTCDYIPGCSVFFSTNLINNNFSYLPEKYFLYFEETDWCIKLKNKGLILKIIPNSLIEHPSESKKMEAHFRVYFYNRNNLLFKLSNSNTKITRLMIILKTLFAIPKLIYLVLKEKNYELKQTFKAHLLSHLDCILLYSKLFSTNNSIKISKNRLKHFLNS